MTKSTYASSVANTIIDMSKDDGFLKSIVSQAEDPRFMHEIRTRRFAVKKRGCKMIKCNHCGEEVSGTAEIKVKAS